MKKVYVGMCADIIHIGHINIIKEARKFGSVTIGLLTDEAISTYKELPVLSYDQRKIIVENIDGVDDVIPQHELDYENNLLFLKPDIVVHGDDWKKGVQSSIRSKVIKLLSTWDGKLIEPKYTPYISSSSIKSIIEDKIKDANGGVTPNQRLKKIKLLLKKGKLIKILEAHNGLTGIIAENTKIEKDEETSEFDGIWESSLTDSTSKGKPDTELVDFSSRFSTIEEILEVSTKPIIVDGDTGGKTEHFTFRVKTLERLGVSAVIIEDKIGTKRNSLFGDSVVQQQDTIENFCRKIHAGKNAQITNDFMIIARIESLILNQGMEDAIRRSKAYVKAGADGILIHSKSKDGDEIIQFCDKFRQFDKITPLVVVPSTFSHLYEDDFKKSGVNIIIYANHLIRAAYPSMQKTAKLILQSGRAKEASEKYCMPIKEIIKLIPHDY
jgi:phosphoenolpyruvate phosphomutase / 2-hydroxyethylphosphonate cytidylyltransferase